MSDSVGSSTRAATDGAATVSRWRRALAIALVVLAVLAVVIQGLAGQLIPPLAVFAVVFVAVAVAVGRLLDDPALAERLGRAGRQRVLEHYTWRTTARRTADWYLDVLRRRGRPC